MFDFIQQVLIGIALSQMLSRVFKHEGFCSLLPSVYIFLNFNTSFIHLTLISLLSFCVLRLLQKIDSYAFENERKSHLAFERLLQQQIDEKDAQIAYLISQLKNRQKDI